MSIRVEIVNQPEYFWRQWKWWRWQNNKTKSIDAMGFLSYSYLFPSDSRHLPCGFLRLSLTLTSLNALVILFFVSQLGNGRLLLGSTPKTKENMNERQKILFYFSWVRNGTMLWEYAPPLVSPYELLPFRHIEIQQPCKIRRRKNI